MHEKILVVEDEPRVARLVGQVLKAMDFEVLTAECGEAAVEAVAMEQPQMVLLDIMLGSGIDGFEVCRRLREFSDVPVIMLTARARDEDVLRAFDAGADDYLTKPFNSKELLARVRAVLRRSLRPEETVTTSWKCGELEIDFARRRIIVQGKSVPLTRTEFTLLRELALNADRVMLHEELLTRVWGPEYRDDVDYIRAYVRYLRRKIEPDPSNPRFILTCSGAGYMLTCPERK